MRTWYSFLSKLLNILPKIFPLLNIDKKIKPLILNRLEILKKTKQKDYEFNLVNYNINIQSLRKFEIWLENFNKNQNSKEVTLLFDKDSEKQKYEDKSLYNIKLQSSDYISNNLLSTKHLSNPIEKIKFPQSSVNPERIHLIKSDKNLILNNIVQKKTDDISKQNIRKDKDR